MHVLHDPREQLHKLVQTASKVADRLSGVLGLEKPVQDLLTEATDLEGRFGLDNLV